MTEMKMQAISAPLCFLLAFAAGEVLLSPSTELRCGRQLVSGLFARSGLPLGYSHVARVPRGACRLNVSEHAPSDNYIAIKLTESSFVVNGHFAVSSPGTYEAAGTRFLYRRERDIDNVFAVGPLQQDVDIMVLYTKKKVDITYEYYIEGSADDKYSTSTPSPDLTKYSKLAEKHSRRHEHYRSRARIPSAKDLRFKELERYLIEDPSDDDEDVVGPRDHEKQYSWKVIGYTQCTRTCGGGYQTSKTRCMAMSDHPREVSPSLCSSQVPVEQRRRCGQGACEPRWRAAAWTICPACGPAIRRRIVGCVQENSKGIAKVSDSSCLSPRPETEEDCDVPNCETSEIVHANKPIFQDLQTDNFKDGSVYTVSTNDTQMGLQYSFSSAGWLYTQWSECVGWCVGGGVQSRGVMCADPAGCAPGLQPEVFQACTPQFRSCDMYDGRWFTGEWSKCTSGCSGRQLRGVMCVGGTGRHLKDSACKDPKPLTERPCVNRCLPTWYFSDWSKCKGSCSEISGVQRRTVYCAGVEGGATEHACAEPRPPDHRACRLNHCTKEDLPNDINTESQVVLSNQILNQEAEPDEDDSTSTSNKYPSECVDKLQNCNMAAQARLCIYEYYTNNCCHSCRKQ